MEVWEVKDYYFSEQAFREFKLGGDNKYEIVNEVLVNGQWLLYTECISIGHRPLSVWADLKYVGRSSIIRYTEAPRWIRQNPNVTHILRMMREYSL